jgi:O-antigen/teichoic acid export membrane protein
MAEVGPDALTAAPTPTTLGLLRFFKHSLVYGGAQVLVRGVSLLLLPLYTRVLSPTDYGVMDIIGIAVTFLTTAISLEISQAVGRYYADTHDPERRRTVASTGLWFTVGAFASFSLLALLASPWIARAMLSTSADTDIVRVAAVGLFAQGVFYFTMEQLRWQVKPQHHALVALVGALTLVGATAVFVLVLHTGVIGVFYGQLVGNAPGVALALWYGREAYALRFDRRVLRKLLAFSVPLVPGTAAVVAAFMVDRIAVRSFMSLAELGLYGIAYRFATVISLVMIGVNGAFMPLVFRHHGEPSTPRTIADIFRYFVGLAATVFVSMSLFSGWILRAITTPKYYDAADVVPLVLLAVTFSSMSLFAPGLLIGKRTRTIAGINVAALILNAALVFSLVPFLGLAGAALGTTISFATAFAAQMLMSQRTYRVPHAWGRIAAAVTVAAVAVAAFWFGMRVAPESETSTSFVRELAVAATTVAVVLALLLRRADLDAVRRVVLGRLPRSAS